MVVLMYSLEVEAV